MSTSTAPLKLPRTLISAETFLNIVDDFAASGYLSNPDNDPVIEVAGVVDLSGRKFPKGFVIERITFHNAVKMGNCVFDGPVQFNGCSFYDQLDFASAKFASGASFSGCSFEVRDIEFTRTALNLNDAQVTGTVDVTLTTIHGCISATRLHLSGDLAFSACTIEGNSAGGTAIVDLADSNIVGSVGFEMSIPRDVRTPAEIVNVATEKTTTGKDPWLQRSTFIDQNQGERVAVRLRNAVVTDVTLSYAHFHGKVDLQGLKCISVASDVGYFACRTGETETWPGETFGGAQIDGDLVLSGADLKLVHLSGIVIEGFVTLIDGLSGQIQIDDGVLSIGRLYDGRVRSEIHVVESTIGNFVMTRWKCRDHVFIHSKRITGVPNPWGIEGVFIESSKIRGNLSFWPGREPARRLRQYLDALAPLLDFFAIDEQDKLARPDPSFLNRWQRSLLIAGNLKIDNCEIDGDIILTGVNVVDLQDGRPGGRIRITNCTMTGGVSFASPVSYLLEKDPEPLLLLLARYFVAREITSRSLLREFVEADGEIMATDVASLIRASPGLALDILRSGLLSNETTALSADAGNVNEALLGENATRGEITKLVRANPDLIRGMLPPEYADIIPDLLESIIPTIDSAPPDALNRVRDFIIREVAAQAVLLRRNLPAEILNLARNRLKNFRIAESFKHAACNTVEMAHLSADRVDLSGLRLRGAENVDALRMRRVDLRYMKIRERLDTWVRLDSTEINAVWKVLDQILLPAANERDNLTAVPAFVKGRNRERDVLSYCFGEDEMKFLESVSNHRGGLHRIEMAVDIPGALDLQHAQIDQLYLSDDAFRDPNVKNKATERGIVLDYAKINKLYVARSQSRDRLDQRHNGFPVPVSLLKLSVQAWFLEERHGSEFVDGYSDHETATADPYLDLLDNDNVFRMSAYLEIEKLLRDRGLEGQANRVFVAGRYRDMRIGFGEEDEMDARAHRRVAASDQGGRGGPRLTWSDVAFRWRAMTRSWATWQPGHGRYRGRTIVDALLRRPADRQYRRKITPHVFRLKRPRREYVGFALCAVWCAALVYFIIRTASAMQAGVGSITLGVLGIAALFAIAFIILRHAMRVFWDQLYWSILAYGTSPVRLVITILILAGFSLTFVSVDRHNFEPTLAAESAETQKQLLALRTDISHASEAGHPDEAKWDETKSPKARYWPLGERVWMTLRFHVPLVAAVVSEEWQPAADKPLRVLGLEPPSDEHPKPSWWPFRTWPRARDWFGLMLWANWLLWPFFLPYLIRKLIRYQVEE